MKIFLKTIIITILLSQSIYVYGTEIINYSPEFVWLPHSQFVILSKDVAINNYTPDTWIIEELNPATGIFNTVSIVNGCAKYAFAPQFDLTNMLMFATEKYTPTIDVIFLTTGKVAGTFTVDVSPGTDMDDFIGDLRMLISPDGSRIFVNNGDVFDGKTYKKITQLSPPRLPMGGNIQWDNFSEDNKYAYLIGTRKDWSISVMDLSTLQIIKTIKMPDSTKGMTLIELYGSNVIFSKQKEHVSYVWNIRTGALSASIPTNEDCDPSVLSPKASWLLCSEKYKIDAYEISSGNWAAAFTEVTKPGAIISWPDDHTFIYNTTQQLIYFDIKQNKIIKQIPIIRPWEKPGWKPEIQ